MYSFSIGKIKLELFDFYASEFFVEKIVDFSKNSENSNAVLFSENQ